MHNDAPVIHTGIMDDELVMKKSLEHLDVSSHSTSNAGHGKDSEPTYQDVKLQEIEQANESQNFGALVTLATSAGGLLQDNVRQEACELQANKTPSSNKAYICIRAHPTWSLGLT